jgi:hypothetical protein
VRIYLSVIEVLDRKEEVDPEVFLDGLVHDFDSISPHQKASLEAVEDIHDRLEFTFFGLLFLFFLCRFKGDLHGTLVDLVY